MKWNLYHQKLGQGDLAGVEFYGESLWTLLLRNLAMGGKESAIKIDCEDISICIISAYMPTNNGNHSDDLYRKCLDELSEIVAKYDFCNIELAGDLNASFIRPKPTVINKPFMGDIVEMEFVLPDKYPRDSTFHHFNDYSVSQIDYILPFRHCDFITDIKIHHRESLNTSTPIVATRPFSLPYK